MNPEQQVKLKSILNELVSELKFVNPGWNETFILEYIEELFD